VEEFMSAILQDRYYTYEEWLELERPDEVWRMELVDGMVYSMAAPGTLHQVVVRQLLLRFGNYLEGKTCKIYPGLGVRLAKDTVFEPDLSIICDKSKLDKRGYNGAPDLIIEILSSSNIRHDRITKRKAYRKAGVKEYWIVCPEERVVEVHILVNDIYTINDYTEEDGSIPVNILPGFSVDMKAIFPDEELQDEIISK